MNEQEAVKLVMKELGYEWMPTHGTLGGYWYSSYMVGKDL